MDNIKRRVIAVAVQARQWPTKLSPLLIFGATHNVMFLERFQLNFILATNDIKRITMSQQVPLTNSGDRPFTCCSSVLCKNATAYSWCYHFQCTVCEKTKFWCSLCNSCNFLSTLKAAEVHYRRLHGAEDTASKTIVMLGSTETKVNNTPSQKGPGCYFHSYTGETNRQFYEHDENGNGLNYLVNYAAHSSPCPSPCLNPEEIRYHLLLAKLCMSISRSKRETLGKILELTYKFSRIDALANDISYDYMSPRIPTSDINLRNMYIDGKHAISTNVPRPVVNELKREDCHAYVSLFDILADVVGNCCELIEMLKLSNIDKKRDLSPCNIRSVMDTRRYQKIVENARTRCQTGNPVIFWATMWSDDHEPNNLLQNRGSVHLQTVTIACDPSSNDSVLNNPRSRTYPVSISAKSADHEESDQEFAKELRQLARDGPDGRCHTYVWNPLCQQYEEVYLEILVTLQDQPERRNANFLLGGNSQFHARWMWSCDIAKIARNLPACDKCLESLLQHDTTDWSRRSECLSCLSFSFERDRSPMLAYAPPQGYPPNADQDKFGMLHPFRLTYDRIIQAVDLSRNQIESGKWTVKEANTYLKTYCLQEKIIVKLLNNAVHRHRLFQSSREDGNDIEDEVSILRDIANRFPDLLDNQPYPGNWCSPVTLDQRIDVIMHLLFLGITKSTVFMIRDWTKLKEKGTAFTNYVRTTLQNAPSISWCATAAYTGEKLGGWISENYMALARLSKWFYSRLKQVVTESVYVPPRQPVDKWKTAECQQWFKRHGIKLTQVIVEKNISLSSDVKKTLQAMQQQKKPLARAGVVVMRKVISCYMVASSRNNTLSLVTEHLPSHEMIMKLVCALHSMTAAIMAPGVSEKHVEHTDRLIKIFLSIYSRIEQMIRSAEGSDSSTKQKADWVRHYNFTSLLNLPDIMREFGPLRNLWEGGECGEKFIRRSKDAISNGLRGNWEVVTARKILVDQSIRNMWNRYEIQVCSANEIEQNNLDIYRREGKIYRSAASIRETFRDALPISVFVVRNQIEHCISVTAVAYDDSSDRGLTFVTFARMEIVTNDGFHNYFRWRLSDSNESLLEGTGMCDNLSHQGTELLGGLLLPRSGDDVEQSRSDKSIQSYTLITSDWKEIAESGSVEQFSSLTFSSFP